LAGAVIRRSGVGDVSGEEAEFNLSEGFGSSQERQPLLSEGDAFSLLPSVDMVCATRREETRKGGKDGSSQA